MKNIALSILLFLSSTYSKGDEKFILSIYSIENRMMEDSSKIRHATPFKVSYLPSDSIKEIFKSNGNDKEIKYETPENHPFYLRVEGSVKLNAPDSCNLKIYVEYNSCQYRYKRKIKLNQISIPDLAKNTGKIFYPKGIVIKVAKKDT